MERITNMILYIVCFLSIQCIGNINGAPPCCVHISSNPGCKVACEKLSSSASLADQMSSLAAAAHHCPSDLMEFWECARTTLSVMREVQIWSGRPCCNFTRSRLCSEACARANSIEDVENHCSRSTEDALFSCILRQRNGEQCCKRTQSPNCMHVCWNHYLTNSLSGQENRQILRHQCQGSSREVVQCIQKQTKAPQTTNHADSLHCCDMTVNTTCMTTCKWALRTINREQEVVDELIKGCGKVSAVDPLWGCFLSEDQKKLPHEGAGIDSAKLHCCQRADTSRCRNLCMKTYGSGWESWKDLESNCGYSSSPISTVETVMHTCISEVEWPCQLGCSGLEYCTNFNNRPTELFHRCNAQADQAAKEDIRSWLEGVITIPRMSIPVKNIQHCEPEMWKAIACALQIRPCFKKPVPPQICMEDCIYILNKCVDPARLHGQMVKDLCNRLPKSSEGGDCISVKRYLVESPYKGKKVEVTNPCTPNPCNENEICHIHRRKCKHPDPKHCPTYVCNPACPMGQIHSVLVPKNTYVLFPRYLENSRDTDECEKYKMCHCGHTGTLTRCENLPCVRKQSCIISGTQNPIAHGQHFRSGCNDCVCFGGEKICTKKACPTQLTNKLKWTGIHNCDCPRQFSPVCGSNGKTYPSACVAQCVGETNYRSGSCFDVDPCHGNPCELGYRCVARRQVCLGHRSGPCEQYECVSGPDSCNHHHHEPVCDVSGEEFTNMCLLLARQRKLAYRGHCLQLSCSQTSGPVCGHNGETYEHECAALADRTTIDYFAKCKTFGHIAGEGFKTVCAGVECPTLSPSNCQGVVPPWGCCPVCAAELRVLSSDKLVRMVSEAIRKGPITVRSILDTLSNQVLVAECDVFGYLSIDGDIVILFAPVTDKPTSLQVQACTKEAERFEYLIRSRSPAFISHMILSPLIYAPIRTPQIIPTGAGTPSSSPSNLCTVFLFLIAFIQRILE